MALADIRFVFCTSGVGRMLDCLDGSRILVGLANHKRGVIEQDAHSQDEKDIRMSYVYARIHGLKTDPYSRTTNCKEVGCER